jgi:hypothetical protein
MRAHEVAEVRPGTSASRPHRVVQLLLATALLAWAAGAAWPGMAAAVQTYSEGAGQALPFTLVAPSPAFAPVTAASASLSLALRPLTIIDAESPVWQGSAVEPNPRDVCPLPGGGILMVDKENKFVARLDAQGAVTWRYDVTGGPSQRPFSAQPATFDGKQCVLIAERLQCRVFAVTLDEAKQVVWEYGTLGEAGLGIDHLMDPFSAVQLANGNVLISDENGGNRVIEVQASDYAPGAANDGYRADHSIVWQYGTPGVAGLGANQVRQPRWPQRLLNGPGPADDTTLFTDSSGQRVIEVLDADDSVVWQYGTPGVAGLLHSPNRATRITSGALAGQTVIADSDGHRLVWVAKTGQLVRELDLNTFFAPPGTTTNGSDPRAAVYGPDMSLWVPDPGYHRIISIGYEGSAVAEWAIDCGKPNARKAFSRLKLTGKTADGDVQLGDFALRYRTDGKSWRNGTLRDGRTCVFKAGTAGKVLHVELTITSHDRSQTPVLDSFTLFYDKAGTSPSGGPTGDKTNGHANDGSSGVYIYAGVGGTSTSGSGSGAGSSGTGTGAAGNGSAAGSAAAGAASGAPAQSAGAGIAAPPASTATGAAQTVSGVKVQGLEGVSGIALTAAPGAHLVEEQNEAHDPLPLGAIVVVAIGALAGILLPWPALAARLREVGGFDHTTLRRFTGPKLLR